MSTATTRGRVRGVPPVRVLLVDDEQMLIEALAAKLSTIPDIVVVGHCAAQDPHPEVLATLLRPDVITIEIAQGEDAATLLALFHAAWPLARLVVLTASRDPQQAVDAARAGADGWVSKESSIDTLAHAMRSVSRGHACFPPAQLGRVLQELRADVNRAQRHVGPLELLTPRERDVLMCLVQGHCPAEIADELGMSANTVRTHNNKIFAKLGVHSRLEAVAVARGALRRIRPSPPTGAPPTDALPTGAPPTGVPRALTAQESATGVEP